MVYYINVAQLKTSIWCTLQWMFSNVKRNISIVTLMAPKLSMDTTSGDNSTSCCGKVNRRKMTRGSMFDLTVQSLHCTAVQSNRIYSVT